MHFADQQHGKDAGGYGCKKNAEHLKTLEAEHFLNAVPGNSLTLGQHYAEANSHQEIFPVFHKLLVWKPCGLATGRRTTSIFFVFL